MSRRKRTTIKTGDRYGKLTVLGFSHLINSHKVFNVLCDCGTRKTVTGTHMVQGNTKSCGCLFMELKSKPGGFRGLKRIFTQYKANARNSDRAFELTFEQFVKIVSRICAYCGTTPRKTNPYLRLDGTLKDLKISAATVDRAWILANGIDRKDSDLGYTTNNCVPCCPTCNGMKSDLSLDSFVFQVKLIYVNLRENNAL